MVGRSYKCIYKNPDGNVIMEGRYMGDKPSHAAKKALSAIYKIFEQKNINLEGDVKFGLHETTRNSKKKYYWYCGKKCIVDDVELYSYENENGKKSYLSVRKIEQMGGFKKIFGKEKNEVKPSITFNQRITIKKERKENIPLIEEYVMKALHMEDKIFNDFINLKYNFFNSKK
jgi:hypothetical protein